MRLLLPGSWLAASPLRRPSEFTSSGGLVVWRRRSQRPSCTFSFCRGLFCHCASSIFCCFLLLQYVCPRVLDVVLVAIWNYLEWDTQLRRENNYASLSSLICGYVVLHVGAQMQASMHGAAFGGLASNQTKPKTFNCGTSSVDLSKWPSWFKMYIFAKYLKIRDCNLLKYHCGLLFIRYIAFIRINLPLVEFPWYFVPTCCFMIEYCESTSPWVIPTHDHFIFVHACNAHLFVVTPPCNKLLLHLN